MVGGGGPGSWVVPETRSPFFPRKKRSVSQQFAVFRFVSAGGRGGGEASIVWFSYHVVSLLVFRPSRQEPMTPWIPVGNLVVAVASPGDGGREVFTERSRPSGAVGGRFASAEQLVEK